MTITLYHSVSARSFRPLWMLEELRLPYDLKMLPFPPRLKGEAYLKINPLGTIPAFFDGATRMTESAVYRPRLVRHRIECYAASAAGESWFCRTAAGVWNPCRSMSQVVL